MNKTSTTTSNATALAAAVANVAAEVTRTGIDVSGISAQGRSAWARPGLIEVGIHVSSLRASGPGEAAAAVIASLWNLTRDADDLDSNAYWRGEWPGMGIFVTVYTGRDVHEPVRDCESVEFI